jgi:hypothetical protein
MNGGACVAAWLLLNFLSVACYDVYAYYALPADQSVSFWLYNWSSEFPMLACSIGLIVGHLLWPLKVTKGGNG